MSNIKAFNIRLPKEIWAFLKKQSIDQEKAMNVIVVDCLEKYKKKFEKKLTQDDAVVS
jgi:ATP-dependent protease Clp ATPase subunit